jgi:hypothetical protein
MNTNEHEFRGRAVNQCVHPACEFFSGPGFVFISVHSWFAVQGSIVSPHREVLDYALVTFSAFASHNSVLLCRNDSTAILMATIVAQPRSALQAS